MPFLAAMVPGWFGKVGFFLIGLPFLASFLLRFFPSNAYFDHLIQYAPAWITFGVAFLVLPFVFDPKVVLVAIIGIFLAVSVVLAYVGLP